VPTKEVFLEAVKAYTPKYDGDYDYIRACFKHASRVAALNLVASQVNQIGVNTGL
jgi:hypothetical protein